MTRPSVRMIGVLAILVLLAPASAILAASATPSNTDPPILAWRPSGASLSSGLHTLSGEIGLGPGPFWPITPCRQYDSRNTTPLATGVNRTVVVTGAPCGIPGNVNAVAVNITIFNIIGATGNGVFKVGTTAPPTTAWINYPSYETQRGNAGIVALPLVVQVAQGAGSVDFTVDVSGYFYNGENGATADFTLPAQTFFSIVGNYSGGGVLFGRNDQATAAFSLGVRGRASSTGAGSSAVYGEEFGASGVVHGVSGFISSTSSTASGGLFEDGAGAVGVGLPSFSAGVTGNGKNGVVGHTSTPDGDGVAGVAENTAGTATGFGVVGHGANAFEAIVGGYAGPSPSITLNPHPTNASLVIAYPSLTGNEAGTYFRGTAVTTGREFVIDVPEDFRLVTDPEGLTVQLTPVGAAATMFVLSEDLNQIVVRSSRDIKFHYLVQGVRQGHKDFNPMQSSLDQRIFLPQGPDGLMQSAWPDSIKLRLLSNGTYNPDGTLNMETAERIGLAQAWRVSDEQTRAITAKRAEARANDSQTGKH
jgi:hypothetical protein